jgi:Fur family ferric uptake transcriptional regulator
MIRNTRQRDAIRQVFCELRRPLSPQEVLEQARRRLPRLGLATVYRNLKAMEEDGWLSTVQLPGRPLLYERADKQHHHYFECRACHRVYDVPACPRNLNRLVPQGFEVEQHEIVLYGRCHACAARD